MELIKLEYNKISSEKPLDEKLIKSFIKMYQLTDTLFFKTIKKNKISASEYLENLKNIKNGSLESFCLIKNQRNLVGFYNLNINNNVLYKNFNNIMILKKKFNKEKFKVICSILSEHFKMTRLPKKSLYIDRIVINRKYQFQGYGKIILQNIINESEYKKISLHVNKINKNALNFYFRNNFIIYDENINFYTLIYNK